MIMKTLSSSNEEDLKNQYSSLVRAALQHLNEKQPNDAISTAQQAIDMFPDGRFAGSARSVIARAYIQLKKYKESEILFNKIISEDPTDDEFRCRRAQLYWHLGKCSTGSQQDYYYKLALEDYIISQNLNFNNTDHLDNQASLYRRLNLHSKAIKCLEKSFGLNAPGAIDLYKYAHSLYSLNRHSEALVQCKKALGLDSTHQLSLQLQATLCDKLVIDVNSSDDPLAFIEITVPHVPNPAESYDQLISKGRAHLNHDQCDEAMEAFKAAIDLDHSLDNSLAWEHLADCCAMTKSYHEALCYYHMAITHQSHEKNKDIPTLQLLRTKFTACLSYLYPSNTITDAGHIADMLTLHVAMTAMDEHNYALAMEKLTDLTKTASTSPTYIFSLLLSAHVHRLLGKFEQSIGLYSQYLALVPYDMNARALNENVIALSESFEINTRYITDPSNAVELDKTILTELMGEFRIKASTTDCIWEHTQIHERILRFLTHDYAYGLIPEVLKNDLKAFQNNHKFSLKEVNELTQLYCLHPTTIQVADGSTYIATNRREFYKIYQISWHVADFYSRALLTGAAGGLTGIDGDIEKKLKAIMISSIPHHVMFAYFGENLVHDLTIDVNITSERQRLHMLNTIQYFYHSDPGVANNPLEVALAKRCFLPDQYAREAMMYFNKEVLGKTTLHEQTSAVRAKIKEFYRRDSDEARLQSKHHYSTHYTNVLNDPYKAPAVLAVHAHTQARYNPFLAAYASILHPKLKSITRSSKSDDSIRAHHAAIERFEHPKLYRNLASLHQNIWYGYARGNSREYDITNLVTHALYALKYYSSAIALHATADAFLKRGEIFLSLALIKTNKLMSPKLTIRQDHEKYDYKIFHEYHFNKMFMQKALDDFATSKRIHNNPDNIALAYHSQLLAFITDQKLFKLAIVEVDLNFKYYPKLPNHIIPDLDVNPKRPPSLLLLDDIQIITSKECTIS